jgi:DMSO reductase family type II enzyme iron-sulfur subunit
MVKSVENNSGTGKVKTPKRQIATVIDLSKCMGCQTCVVACKNIWTEREGADHMRWMNVATAPGPLFPRDFEKKGGGFDENGQAQEGKLPSMVDSGDNFQFNHDEVFYQGKGQSVKLEPTSAMGGKPEWGYNWEEDQGSGEWPNPYFFYLPRKCNHCTKPACVEACSRNAITKREEDGVVLINQDRCEGHRHCVEACPYKMVFFNPVSQKSEKCIECFPRTDKGIAPACNRQCPGRTRAYGYLDDVNSQVYKLVKKWKVALPLHPEYGTSPNVYYVPPLSTSISYDENGEWTDDARIPDSVLEGYFGKDVHRALDIIKEEREKRKNDQPSELIDLLISKNWHDRFSVFTKPATE